MVLEHFDDPKAFIDSSNGINDIYENIDEYNPNKKDKILIAFDDMIAYRLSNNKLNPIVTELFIRGRKLNISLVFIRQSYFAVPKNIRLNSAHHFIKKIPNKQESQHITISYSSDIDFKCFINLYKKCIAKPYSFLVNDTTLASDNLLHLDILFKKEYKK